MRIFNKFKGTKGFISTWQRVIRLSYMITEQAKQRVRILAFWDKHGFEATQEAFGTSSRTLFRWASKLNQANGQLEALNPASRAPQTKRQRQTAKILTDRIIALRAEHPRLGKDKLYGILKDEGYETGSISTVGRILGDLKKKGLIPKQVKVSLSAKTGKMIERPYKPRKKQRRPKGHRVLEVDTIVRYIDGVKRYILTAIDTEGKTTFAGAYTNHGSASAADFLSKARTVIPLCPNDTQSDNGSEFDKYFHKVAKQTGEHFYIHPRTPKENAHIERFNRTLNEEFLIYHRALLRDDVSAFNEALVEWLLWYNTKRPHYALGNISPFKYIMSTLPAAECHMLWTHTST